MAMDRDIAPGVQRKRRQARVVKMAAPIALAVTALLVLPAWLRPSVARSTLRTAFVTVGPIEATVSASGLVQPALERVVSSPMDARVLRVLARPGATVAPGDAVVELDVRESEVALARAENDLKVKDNQQQQTRLGYERTLVDLDGRIKVKALDLEGQRATLESHRKLATLGLLSTEELRRSELAVQQATIELTQLQEERANAERVTTVELEGLSLERASLERDVDERRRQLQLATTKADRTGVLTWIVTGEGAIVHKGDVLARIADLSVFRVEATASDVHAGQIHPGVPVLVRLDDVALDGQISEVYPSIENGSVRFVVALAEGHHPRLRPSLRADVEVMADRRTRTLTLKRGPYADAGGTTLQVFVIRGNHAVRTTVQAGVTSFDAIEITSGLVEGDEVIVSDMQPYLHLAEVALR
jgi:HlyD family secretion protein